MAEINLFNNGGRPWAVFSFPFPPSINHYYGRTRSGQVFIKAPGMAFRKTVGQLVAAEDLFHGPIAGRVSLQVHLHVPDARRRDLDNPLKALKDAMTHAGVFEDDCQVDVLLVERHGKVKGGSAYVSVFEV